MSYTLFVARDKKGAPLCPGSRLCAKLVEYLPSEYVTVQNVAGYVGLPTYVTGTPTLVSNADGEVLRGTPAVEQLQHLAITYAVHRGMVAEATARSGGGKGKGKGGGGGKGKGGARGPTVGGRNREEEEEEEDTDMAELWSSTPHGEGDDDDEFLSTKKVSGEDLARAVHARAVGQPAPPPPGGQAPLPPPQEED